MNTVAQEMEKTRRDVAPGDPNFRWQGPNVSNLSERVRAAQERIRQQNQVRTPNTVAVTDLSFTVGTGDAARIMHDIGLANCAESHRFVRRFLGLEQLVVAQGALIDALVEDIAALKTEKVPAG